MTFYKFFEEQMRDPAFAKGYEKARSEIDAADDATESFLQYRLGFEDGLAQGFQDGVVHAYTAILKPVCSEALRKTRGGT